MSHNIGFIDQIPRHRADRHGFHRPHGALGLPGLHPADHGPVPRVPALLAPGRQDLRLKVLISHLVGQPGAQRA
jgi:hypothetical protein